MERTEFPIRYVVYWLLAVAAYLILCGLTSLEFSTLGAMALSNLAVLPILYHRYRTLEAQDPKSLVSFDEDNIIVRGQTISLRSVKVVALDRVNDHIYFNLPYNRVDTLPTSTFKFPATQYHNFKSYLEQGLHQETKIIANESRVIH